MSEQKPSLLIPPNGGQIPSEESKLSEEYFAKVVGILIELVQTRKDNAYCMKEEDGAWTKDEMVDLMVRCHNKLRGSCFSIQGIYNQDKHQMVIVFQSTEIKRNLVLVFKVMNAKDHIYDINQGVSDAINGAKTSEELYGSTDGFTVGTRGHVPLKDNQVHVVTEVQETYLRVAVEGDRSGQYWNIAPNTFKRID
jgi:hypothetical protein